MHQERGGCCGKGGSSGLLESGEGEVEATVELTTYSNYEIL